MIIFGLGNPGFRYRSTRHNTGYIFLDRLVRNRKAKFRRKHGFRTARIGIAGQSVVLVKAPCYMNESGYAVSNFLEGRIEPLMIILDDINLPLGKIRLRNKGSDGGHLGLRSIIKALGTTDFARLRIGVGRSMEDAASYVLDRFTREEKTILRKVLDQGIVGVEMIFKQNFVKAQNYINAVDLQDNTRQ